MLLRELRRVEQLHGNGCFIACLAMLKGITYEEAFKLIHPDKDMAAISYYDRIGLTPEESIQRLEQLGLGPVHRPLRQLRNLRRTALLLIRWEHAPTLLHGVVFDASTKKFLDPGYLRKPKTYERQLDTVLYFKAPELTHRIAEARRAA
jgi:hypothetical protein